MNRNIKSTQGFGFAAQAAKFREAQELAENFFDSQTAYSYTKKLNKIMRDINSQEDYDQIIMAIEQQLGEEAAEVFDEHAMYSHTKLHANQRDPDTKMFIEYIPKYMEVIAGVLEFDVDEIEQNPMKESLDEAGPTYTPNTDSPNWALEIEDLCRSSVLKREYPQARRLAHAILDILDDNGIGGS